MKRILIWRRRRRDRKRNRMRDQKRVSRGQGRTLRRDWKISGIKDVKGIG